jgi:hypothetical protein
MLRILSTLSARSLTSLNVSRPDLEKVEQLATSSHQSPFWRSSVEVHHHISSLSFNYLSLFSHHHQPIDLLVSNSQFQIPKFRILILISIFFCSFVQSFNFFFHFLIQSDLFRRNGSDTFIHSFNLYFCQSSFLVSVI